MGNEHPRHCTALALSYAEFKQLSHGMSSGDELTTRAQTYFLRPAPDLSIADRPATSHPS
jgi:hypothetical protein